MLLAQRLNQPNPQPKSRTLAPLDPAASIAAFPTRERRPGRERNDLIGCNLEESFMIINILRHHRYSTSFV